VTVDQKISLAHALVVDDHPLFCDALTMTLRSIPEIQTVRAASLLSEALKLIEGGATFNIVLLDLNLPDVNGLDGLIRLRNLAKDVPILVVSSMADNRMISSVMRAGAQGFVPKHSKRETFLSAFTALARGETFVPSDFVEVPTAPGPGLQSSDILRRLSTLTNQQSRILQLICEGKLNKQIAYDLSIAETTVKAHVTAIMRKLGVQSRTQAVLMANQVSFSSVLPNGE